MDNRFNLVSLEPNSEVSNIVVPARAVVCWAAKHGVGVKEHH